MSNAQRTEGWHKDRLGRVTASRVKAVMMKKETAGRQNLMAELICERLTGEPTKGFFLLQSPLWGGWVGAGSARRLAFLLPTFLVCAEK